MRLVYGCVFMLSIICFSLSCDRDSSNPVDTGPANERGSIEVCVVDQFELPYEGVTIHLESQNDVSVADVQTNGEGIARFDSLPAGKYAITLATGRMDGNTVLIDDEIREVRVSAGEVLPITYNYTFNPDSISGYGTLNVRVEDEHDNPIEDAAVVLFEIGENSFTYRDRVQVDEEGIAHFDSLPPDQYGILESINGVTVVKRSWMYDLTVSGGETYNVVLHYPVGPADIVVKAELMSESNSEYDNTTVFFPDFVQTILLDTKGKGLLNDMVLDLTLSHLDQLVDITRNDLTIQRTALLKRDPDGWYYYDVTIGTPPEVEIIVEHEDTALSDRSFLLSATGYDFEDGDLPDNALTWTSDRDGDLGAGRAITPMLTAGQHTITLTGEDSVGEKSTDSVIVSVSHFSDYSYFPLPNKGVWKYRYTPATLVATNDKGETGTWTLADMTVMSHDTMSRTCTMEWNVENDRADVVCHYSLTDTIVFDGNRSLVTASDEKLIVSDAGEIVEELSVETVYTPSYPLLADYLDPQAGAHEEITVTAESDMKYTRPDIGTQSWTDTGTVAVSFETSSPEYVTTATGRYATIPLASTYNGVVRTWWLARGIGIVRMEYDLFGETVTASLYATNVRDFSEDIPTLVAYAGNFASVLIQLDASGDAAERMRKIMDVMRGICPR